MYKITIRQIADPEDGERYGKETDVYEQIVADLNIPAVVAIVNKLP